MGLLKSQLRWEVRAIADVRPVLRQAMYRIYAKYYENTTFQAFQKDLDLKNEVILLFDNEEGDIQGFSTLVEIDVPQKKGSARVVFSGDTIIEKKYWGQRTLGVAFLIVMFLKKLKKPWQPLYWFLISKGYKTYLLMANNFENYYPRMEAPTPEGIKSILESASQQLFPGCYQSERGIVVFPAAKAACLKGGIADIDPNLLKVPRIRFFAEKNPRWHEGEELACLAEMKLSMPFSYYKKSMTKLLGKREPRSAMGGNFSPSAIK